MKIVMASPVRKMIKFTKAPVLVEINGKEIQHPEAYILHSEPGKDIVTITGIALMACSLREHRLPKRPLYYYERSVHFVTLTSNIRKYI